MGAHELLLSLTKAAHSTCASHSSPAAVGNSGVHLGRGGGICSVHPSWEKRERGEFPRCRSDVWTLLLITPRLLIHFRLVPFFGSGDVFDHRKEGLGWKGPSTLQRAGLPTTTSGTRLGELRFLRQARKQQN